MQQEQFNYEVGQVETGANMLASMGSTLLGNGGAGDILSGSVNLAKADVNHDYYIKQQMAQIEKQQMLPNTRSYGWL